MKVFKVELETTNGEVEEVFVYGKTRPGAISAAKNLRKWLNIRTAIANVWA